MVALAVINGYHQCATLWSCRSHATLLCLSDSRLTVRLLLLLRVCDSERAGAKKSRKRRNAPAAKGDQGAASLAGMSDKEKAKIAALDKSDKKGSSIDATTGSAREGVSTCARCIHFMPAAPAAPAGDRLPPPETTNPRGLLALTRAVCITRVTGSGVAQRKEREISEAPEPAPAPQPEQRGKSGKKSKKKKKK
jgi:hypothetical protein